MAYGTLTVFSCILPIFGQSRSQGTVCLGSCIPPRTQREWETPAWPQCWAKLTRHGEFPISVAPWGLHDPGSLFLAKCDGGRVGASCAWATFPLIAYGAHCASAVPGHLRTPQGL